MTTFAKLSICLLLLAVLYSVFGPPIIMDDVFGRDGPETKAAVLKIIPVGSPIDEAKTIMEAKSFYCRMMYNQSYAGDAVIGGRQITYPPADLLWCDSGDRSYLALIISKRWQVIFVAKDGTVASLVAGVGLTGP